MRTGKLARVFADVAEKACEPREKISGSASGELRFPDAYERLRFAAKGTLIARPLPRWMNEWLREPFQGKKAFDVYLRDGAARSSAVLAVA